MPSLARSGRPWPETRRALPLLLALVTLAGGAVARADGLSPRRAALYQQSCARCHQRADLGVPVAGDRAAWSVRNEKGFEALLRNTVLGVRNMPPLGTCGACSEEDLRALVEFLSGLADPRAPEPEPR